jgi:glyoxylate carboligase
MTRMSGGEAVVRALAGCGVDLVFGIPGTHTLGIQRHLGAAGIRHVTPRHEQGGGYAADGYARVSGRPGVVLDIGPGRDQRSHRRGDRLRGLRAGAGCGRRRSIRSAWIC